MATEHDTVISIPVAHNHSRDASDDESSEVRSIQGSLASYVEDGPATASIESDTLVDSEVVIFSAAQLFDVATQSHSSLLHSFYFPLVSFDSLLPHLLLIKTLFQLQALSRICYDVRRRSKKLRKEAQNTSRPALLALHERAGRHNLPLIHISPRSLTFRLATCF